MLSSKIPQFSFKAHPDSNAAGTKKSKGIKLTLGVIIGYISMLVYLLSPGKFDFPAVMVCIIAFVIAQLIWPECKLKTDNLLCPLNMAQILFGIQLLLIPLLGMYYGFSKGSLPWLPSDLAINVALLLNTVAYLSFFSSYHYFNRKKQKKAFAPFQHVKTYYPFKPMGFLALIYLFMGLLGFFLYFRSVDQYVNYLSSPAFRFIILDFLAGTPAGAASNFLRPFLPLSVIVFWCVWVDKGKFRPWQITVLVTGIVIFIVVFVSTGFSYNRGAIFGPILGIAAAFSARTRRLSFKFLAVAGCLLLGLGIIWGAYRATDLSISDLIVPGQVFSLVADLDIIDWLQIYGPGPQFIGFFLEQMGFGSQLYWGKTLLSSLLYPLPVLGKPFRLTSGVALYNLSIYDNPEIIDQVVPFQGELFINFHILGVIGGYVLLGYLSTRLQRAFENASNTFETFSFFYFAIWMLFLIGGSLAATCQIYLYFFWAIYFYFLLKSDLFGIHHRLSY